MQASHLSGAEHLEILPLTIVTQEFPARPSALPDIRDFVRRQLTATPLADDEIRALCDRVADVLFDAAGANGAIQVSLRMFGDRTEVDVLQSAGDAFAGKREIAAPGGENLDRAKLAPHEVSTQDGDHPAPEIAPVSGVPRSSAPPSSPGPSSPGPSTLSFADWLSAGLRREGLTMEAAARRLNVSAKTIGRWAGGATEPRLRDLNRIREVFGESPFR
jgi:helix-turn-helix protein